jgi:hypothetical protein
MTLTPPAKNLLRASTRSTWRAHLIPAGDLRVREQPIYSEYDPETSYFSDLYAFQKTGSQTALGRLQRNNAEVVESRTGSGRESRASISTVDFYQPLWMADQYTTTHRARMVFANLVTQLVLPPGGETVTIPAYSGPVDAANAQAGDNSAIQTASGTTSQLTAPVTLFGGYCDVARQWLERGNPGADTVIFGDISRDIARKTEIACLNGSGTSQPLGILQEGAVPSVTVGGQTAAQFLLKLADLMQRIEVAVGEPANFILMHSRRFSWLASLLDANGRPLVSTIGAGPNNAFGTISQQQPEDGLALTADMVPSGYMAGIPIYTSPSLPTANGASTNEDPCVVGVSHLAVRWADPAGIRSFTWDSVVSSTASIRLQALSYGAFKVRYPAAFGRILGLTTPSF